MCKSSWIVIIECENSNFNKAYFNYTHFIASAFN